MAEQQKTVEVPDNVRVRCPLVAFRLRDVRMCVGCDKYAGLQEQIGNNKLPFAQRFGVQCTHPQTRQLFELEQS